MAREFSLTDEQLEQIRSLLHSGRKIEAIKQYREFTGLGLADAKRDVEDMAAGKTPESNPDAPSRGSLTDTQQNEIKALFQSGEKIEAIKRYRTLTGSSLADSKRDVEYMASGNASGRKPGKSSEPASGHPQAGHPHAISSGCGSSVFLITALVAVVYFLT